MSALLLPLIGLMLALALLSVPWLFWAQPTAAELRRGVFAIGTAFLVVLAAMAAIGALAS